MTKLPKGWKEENLGEIATFRQGIQVGLEHHIYEPKEDYVRFLRIVDYTQNTDDIRYIPNPGDKYYVNENDIIMVRYGTPGLIGRGKSGVIANNLFRIQIGITELTNDYLSLFLSQEKIKSYLSSQGSSTMPALNFGQLKKVKITYPPLPEQKRIVSILDKAFDNIEKAKKNIEQNLINSKELFQSKLDEIFSTKGKGWEEKKLEDVCEKIFAGGDVPKSDFSKFKTKNYTIPIYSNGVKDNGLYGYTNIKKVDQPSITISARGTIGFPIKRLDTFYPVIRLIVVIPNVTIINIDYLYFYLFKYDFIQSGTSIPQLTVPMVKPINIKLPPIKEQSNIVKILEELLTETQKLETTYIKQLENLEELKKSLLDKAFKGEL